MKLQAPLYRASFSEEGGLKIFFEGGDKESFDKVMELLTTLGIDQWKSRLSSLRYEGNRNYGGLSISPELCTYQGDRVWFLREKFAKEGDSIVFRDLSEQAGHCLLEIELMGKYADKRRIAALIGIGLQEVEEEKGELG
ncbi:MAG: hypothetical protein UZ21_OP11001000899 [Microgenomates bacterium OLB22]|nr:MAG: hypothetical protein UZ21_OP11001000899 [Microgenomates bacterium OLB22]